MAGQEPKPDWRDLPSIVRDGVQQFLGEAVVSAEIAWGGFGPTPTFLLTLSSGERRFVKGLGNTGTDLMDRGFRLERKVYEQLGRLIESYSPVFFGVVDVDGWQFLVLEDLGAASVPPWDERQAAIALSGLALFHNQPQEISDLPSWVDRFPQWSGGYGRDWAWSLNSPNRQLRAQTAGPATEQLDEWFAHWSERGIASSLEGSTHRHRLLHHDARSDNLRLVDGRLVLFDWAAVRTGPPERDFVGFAISMHLEAGYPLQRMVDWYGNATALNHEALIDAVLAAVGFFGEQAWQEPIPGLPRLRGFQKAQLGVAISWVHDLVGQPRPTWFDTAFEEEQP